MTNTARNNYPQHLNRIVKTTLVVSAIAAAALVLPNSAWAAAGNTQICAPSSSCTVGEFVYDDNYDPLLTASCTVTSRYPDGTLFLNGQALTLATENDGWYFHTFTTSATTGLYRTVISCTVGSDVIRIDKSFEVKDDASTLTSDSVAAATWSYSARTLTSFGSLVSSIWDNATRTLTGATLNSGSIATKSDVDSVGSTVSSVKDKVDSLTTTVNTVSSDVTTIKTETINTIEKLASQPIIERFIEYDENSAKSLNSRLDQTRRSAMGITSSAQYIKGKIALVENKWDKLSRKEILSSLGSLSSAVNSVSNRAVSLNNEWGWSETEEVAAISKSINITLKSAQNSLKKSKSSDNHLNLARLTRSLDSLISAVGSSKNAKGNTLFKKINETSRDYLALNIKQLEVGKILASYHKENKEKITAKAERLTQDVSKINKIPKLSPSRNYAQKGSDQEIKNKLLSLLGIIKTNKEYLSQNSNKAFSSTWLEIGSIVFKSVITNPSSSLSQTVPLRYDLPPEVGRDHILEADEGLEIKFDSEKNNYYISGNFKLAPNESRTVSVRVDEKAFSIPSSEIKSLRKQAEELSKPLNNTSYFAQGVTLKTDIDVSLDKAENLISEDSTPEERIRSYREALIELNAAKVKMEKLKELVASAGSVGTFFGFVGGAQALAVWGMMIVMGGGFVFLALYLRTLKNYDSVKNGQSANLSVAEEEEPSGSGSSANKKEVEEKVVHSPQKPRHGRGFGIKKVAVLLIGMAVLGVGGGFGTGLYTNPKAPKKTLAVASQANKPQKEVLAENTQNSKNEKVRIFVPDGSIVNIYKEKDIDSPIVFTLKSSKEVIKTSEKNGWVKVEIIDGKEKVSGWVDKDFVEVLDINPEEKTDTKVSGTESTVVISDEVENYLKVRMEPVTGDVIKKASAGDKFELVSEEDGWLEIRIGKGKTGWISAEFADITP
jgi:hypothetical protein